MCSCLDYTQYIYATPLNHFFLHILSMTKYNKTSSSLLLSDFIKLKVLNLNLYRIKDHLNLVSALQFTLEYKKQQVEVVKIDAWFTASPPVQKKTWKHITF